MVVKPKRSQGGTVVKRNGCEAKRLRGEMVARRNGREAKLLRRNCLRRNGCVDTDNTQTLEQTIPGGPGLRVGGAGYRPKECAPKTPSPASRHNLNPPAIGARALKFRQGLLQGTEESRL